MFDSRMRTMAIPERVFALCRTLIDGPISEEAVRKKFEPDSLAGTSPYFGPVRDAAEQLGLIINIADEKLLKLNVDSSVIENMKSFRIYINKNIEIISEGQFYRTTRTWMYNSDALFHIEKENQTVSRLAGYINEIDSTLKLDEDAMRAWRFWSSFLGFGYLHDMVFLPNAAIFLHDCIVNSQIEENREYTISEFIEQLQPNISICMSHEDEKKRYMGLALSSAFRTLNDLGIIELKYINDRQDEWKMTTMPMHTFASFITDIKYKGENENEF